LSYDFELKLEIRNSKLDPTEFETHRLWRSQNVVRSQFNVSVRNQSMASCHCRAQCSRKPKTAMNSNCRCR